jgi:hypothetical protein
MQYRFVVVANGKPRNFLSLRETAKGDVIVSQRGRFHSGPFCAFSVAKKSDEITNVTVHPNLRSELGTVTINYKRLSGKAESRKIAHVLGVRQAERLFPVYASIGRNLIAPSCDLPASKAAKAKLVELWPNGSIDVERDSLAFMLLIANPKVRFLIPEDFPRNTIVIPFSYFQAVVFYWAFNQPTKPYWSNFIPMPGDRFLGHGFQLHEALNYTNDLTMLHAANYESIPLRPVVDAG